MAVRRRRWEPVAFASPSLALIALVILFPLLMFVVWAQLRFVRKQVF